MAARRCKYLRGRGWRGREKIFQRYKREAFSFAFWTFRGMGRALRIRTTLISLSYCVIVVAVGVCTSVWETVYGVWNMITEAFARGKVSFPMLKIVVLKVRLKKINF